MPQTTPTTKQSSRSARTRTKNSREVLSRAKRETRTRKPAVSTLRTAEHVFPGHPDKVCDQISDAILDACLKDDSQSRSAVEVLGSHGTLMIGGEVTTQSKIDPARIARRVYADIGYTNELKIHQKLAEQSPEIKGGVDADDASGEGAGDQGIMVGYATSETKELLPKEVVSARALAEALQAAGYGPDGKTQVTLEDGKITGVVASVQHPESESLKDVRAKVKTIIAATLGPVPTAHVNPAGAWSIGGFDADAGLTGRKIIVDQYGPQIPAGGGAFSGKDATKVDRSAAYAARKIACDFVRQGAATATVKIAYAIGVAEPMMVSALVDGEDRPVEDYDLRPRAVIEWLGLDQPIFEPTARAGHFGHGFAWD